MAKCQKRYLVLVGFGLLVIIAAGVWMVFGRKTQIYEKTEEVFGNPLMGYAPCARAKQSLKPTADTSAEEWKL